MKRVLAVALILFSVAFCFYSCQKAPELTITSTSAVDLSVDGSSGSITFTANRDWTASSSDSWVSISPSSGKASDGTVTVTVRCNANTTYDDRTATVTIRMEDLSKTVTVRQPANKGVILPKQLFDLQSDANSIDVEVQANVQYTVSSSVDWIKQAGTKGLTSKTLTFSIEENKTYDPREGKITIKPQDSNVQEQVISVKQAQKDALNVEKTSYEMPYGGGGIEVKVEANVAFEVKPSVDWIQYVETKALSNSTVYLTIAENPTFEKREGTIEIKQQNGSLKHTITVKQAGRIAVTSIELDQTTLTLKPEETASLIATIKPDNATDKTVNWSTSDPGVATVDETGLVRAIKEGTATITAKAGDIKTTCSVSVHKVIPVSSISLNEKKLVIKEEESALLIATVLPDDATYKTVIWESSDEAVASVLDGVVSAKSGGEASITATAGNGLKTAVCEVVVIPKSIPRNQIWYTTTDGNTVSLSSKQVMNANLLSNVYENGVGIMSFDRDLVEVGEYPFLGENNLETITLPEGIVKIGCEAFGGRRKLKRIDLPKSVEVIEQRAFEGCRSLTSIQIPPKVIEIKNMTFDDCNLLEDVSFPEGLEVIGSRAFSRCYKLKDITLPNQLRVIEERAFSGCGFETITLPPTLQTIGRRAFYACDSLKEIIVPEGVTDISSEAFSSCKALAKATILSNITVIPDALFIGCTSLKTVVLPKNVTEIAYAAFDYTGIEHFTIPSTVVRIGDKAFAACEDLLSITCLAKNPPVFENPYKTVDNTADIFAGSKLNLVIYVPKDSFDAYCLSEGWAQYASLMKPLE